MPETRPRCYLTAKTEVLERLFSDAIADGRNDVVRDIQCELAFRKGKRALTLKRTVDHYVAQNAVKLTARPADSSNRSRRKLADPVRFEGIVENSVQCKPPNKGFHVKGLIIRSPWLDKILEGEKTWEMRSRPTKIRGTIGLIKAGSGHVWGTCEIVDCKGPLSDEEIRDNHDSHRASLEVVGDKWRYAWVLDHVVPLDRPIPYEHKSGAVIWATLDEEESRAVFAQLERPHSVSIRRGADPVSKPRTSQAPPKDMRILTLTDGNVRNSHFYLRSAIDFFPESVIGGGNRHVAADDHILVDVGNGVTYETDIAGDKMIFRNRKIARTLFDNYGLRGGDSIRLTWTSSRRLEIRPGNADGTE